MLWLSAPLCLNLRLHRALKNLRRRVDAVCIPCVTSHGVAYNDMRAANKHVLKVTKEAVGRDSYPASDIPIRGLNDCGKSAGLPTTSKLLKREYFQPQTQTSELFWKEARSAGPVEGLCGVGGKRAVFEVPLHEDLQGSTETFSRSSMRLANRKLQLQLRGN